MDEKPYQEIDGDQLSSMLLSPKKIIIGPEKLPPIKQDSHIYLWADGYDENGNFMDEISMFWECEPPEAAILLPIEYTAVLGSQAAHAIYLVPKNYSGKCKVTAYFFDKYQNKIQASREVQIMENKPPTTEIAKIKTSETIIDVEATPKTSNPTPNNENKSLVPTTSIDSKVQEQTQSQDEIERKFTHSTLTQTSIEERRRQQYALTSQRVEKSFWAKSAEMADPTTNKDSWAAGMAYICFATAFTYLEKGEYTTGSLMLVCFLVFAFAKQGLPEGPFTQWLKNRSKTTIQDVRRTIIGDK